MHLVFEMVVDKALVLKYFTKTKEFSPKLSYACAEFVYLGFVLHFATGITVYWNDEIFEKSISNSFEGTADPLTSLIQDNNKFHIILFIAAFLFYVLVLVFKVQIKKLLRAILKLMKESICCCCHFYWEKQYIREMSVNLNDHMHHMLSDDIFQDLNYEFLFKQYMNTKREYKNLRLLKIQNSFKQEDVTQWIDPYLEILGRNLQVMYDRLILIAEDAYQTHFTTQVPMTDEEKMQACFNIFEKSLNPNNPMEKGTEASEDMKGRIRNSL